MQFIPMQYFSCTESDPYLSLTSAHLTWNERDFLPTYAPPDPAEMAREQQSCSENQEV